jgi:hypothetical protein
MYVLQCLFGLTGTPCYVWMWFGRILLVEILWNDPNAMVRLPTDEEVLAAYQQAIGALYPSMSEVYAIADGLKLQLQESGDPVIQNTQNRYYNGWTHACYMSTNIFVFAPNGGTSIIMCSINMPGNGHDSETAWWGGIYNKMTAIYDLTREGLSLILPYW